MSSAILVSNYIRSFIRYIEGIWDDYHQAHPNSTYKDFEGYLRERKSPAAIETCKDIMYNIGNLCNRIRLVEVNVQTIRDQRLNTVKSTLTGITFLFVFVTLVVVGLLVVIYKSSKGNYWALASRVLMLLIFYVIAIGLYGFFIMNFNNQKETVTLEYKVEKGVVDSYRAFMYSSKNKIERTQFETIMTYSKKQVGMSEADKKKLIKNLQKKGGLHKFSADVLDDMDKLLNNQWVNVNAFISNVYNQGEWIERLNNVEYMSSVHKMFQGINKMLGPYYNMMLKSHQDPMDENNKSGIHKILDKFVIDDMQSADLFGLDDTGSRQQDNTILQSMETGVYYKMLTSSLYYMSVYFYPVYKNVSYSKLVKLHTKAESDLTDAEKSHLNEVLAQEPAMSQVVSEYPVKRENFAKELALIQRLSQNETQKEHVIDDFIKLSSASFSTVFAANDEHYMSLMNNTPDATDTKNILIEYTKEFTQYLTSVFTNFVTYELSLLNPRSTQYFIFQSAYMTKQLENLFSQSSTLQVMDPEYKSLITTIVIDTIVPAQKNMFVKNFYDFSRDSADEKSLRLLSIQNKMNEVVNKIAANMSRFNISVAANADYISSKIAGKDDNLSNAVTSAIEIMLTNIDFQVNTLKSSNGSTLAGSNQEARFVEAYEFIDNLDKKQFSTLQSVLNLKSIKSLLSGMSESATSASLTHTVFRDREYSAKQGKYLMGISTALACTGITYYCIQLYRNLKKSGVINKILPDSNKGESALRESVVTNELLSLIAKAGIPFSAVVLLLSIFRSYVIKSEAEIDFDKSIMQDNTETIKDTIKKLDTLMTDISKRVNLTKQNQSIGELEEITQTDKTKLYELMKSLVINYDKCNYIIGISKDNLPFPYAEVVADGAMCLITVGAIGYILYKFAPVNRIVELKELIEYRQAAATLVNDPSFVEQVQAKIKTHDASVDTILFTVKALGIVAVIIFMLVYSSKITGASKIYKSGLYNSNLMSESKCCGKT